MSKAMILDRLARAMGTLGRRKGRPLTPRQRVAAAQRWNSLADISEEESTRLYDNWMNNKSVYHLPDEILGRNEFEEFDAGARKMGLYENADNPFLSDNPYKYQEQSEFLDWCRYNRVRPTPQALKQYRWETYQTLPYRQRQWIANKDDIGQTLRDEGFVSPYADNLRTLQDLDDAVLDYTGSKYDFMELPVYESLDEFPDNFDYMWRY